MNTGKKVYDKLTKFIKLSAIWVIKILFGPCHFKNVSIFKRIYYAINGGFMPDQIVLYNLNKKNKKNYLSEFDWYKSRYINESYNFILNNKLVCSDLLKQYISVPETLCIKKCGVIYSSNNKINDYHDIIEMLKDKKDLYIKPINIGKGIGVYRLGYDDNRLLIDYNETTENEFLSFLKNRDNYFISTCIRQSNMLDKIYNKTTNTIRLITVRNPETNKCEVLYAVQRIGTKETIPVDNGSRGGLVALIDIETGILSSAKSIQRICNYEKHPDSNNQIKGIKIEKWNEIKKEFVNLMEKFPYLYFVAWDILLTDDGPYVIEANTSSGVNIIQLWGGQRNEKLGNFYKAHNIIKK